MAANVISDTILHTLAIFGGFCGIQMLYNDYYKVKKMRQPFVNVRLSEHIATKAELSALERKLEKLCRQVHVTKKSKTMSKVKHKVCFTKKPSHTDIRIDSAKLLEASLALRKRNKDKSNIQDKSYIQNKSNKSDAKTPHRPTSTSMGLTSAHLRKTKQMLKPVNAVQDTPKVRRSVRGRVTTSLIKKVKLKKPTANNAVMEDKENMQTVLYNKFQGARGSPASSSSSFVLE